MLGRYVGAWDRLIRELSAPNVQLSGKTGIIAKYVEAGCAASIWDILGYILLKALVSRSRALPCMRPVPPATLLTARLSIGTLSGVH